ncbi:MAG: hypothetical protein IJ074_05665 [Clostridia bacterium]|nr:hypothetical protein [Clostridia bacterium]
MKRILACVLVLMLALTAIGVVEEEPAENVILEEPMEATVEVDSQNISGGYCAC